MTKSASLLENEFVMLHPPLVVQGEFTLQQAKHNWSQNKQPVLLLDLHKLRLDHREALQALPHEKAKIESPAQPELFGLPSEPIIEEVTPFEAPAPLGELITEVGETTQVVAETATHNTETYKPVFSLSLPSVAFPSLSAPHFSLPSYTFDLSGFSRAINIGSHFFLGAAVALLLLFAGPILILESRPLISQAIEQLQPFFVKPIAQSPNNAIPSPTPTFEPNITSPEDVFSISIPDLEITSAIIPNVDPNDPKAYTTALKKGIAHAQGTGLPDQLEFSKTIYLFAHSTDAPWNILRYNAQFYALKDAEPGQKIAVTFWGEEYSYTIESKHIIEAQDISYMQAQTDKEQLILQTCYPPGTSEKRLILIATPSANLQ